MKSLEHMIYDILIEGIGVQGSDKPMGVQGGFSSSFASWKKNSRVNIKRDTFQQKNAAPIASFEGGRDRKTPVPVQGDAATVGDLSARGAAQEGGKNPYRSIRTKLKEMNDLQTRRPSKYMNDMRLAEDDADSITMNKKKKTENGEMINKPSDQTEQPHQPSTLDTLKKAYHDAMGGISSMFTPPASPTNKEKVPGVTQPEDMVPPKYSGKPQPPNWKSPTPSQPESLVPPSASSQTRHSSGSRKRILQSSLGLGSLT